MTLAADLVTTLTGNGAVSALVAARVYPLRLPETRTLPAITYQFVTGGQVVSSQGNNPTGNYHVQLDCWAAGYLVADDLARKVIAALDAATLFKAVHRDRRDDLDTVTEMPRVMLEFSLWSLSP